MENKIILEAVWLKDGKELFTVDPVIDIECREGDIEHLRHISVYNGHGWYYCGDLDTAPDDFIIRIKKK